jgi:putative endonuclease
MKNSKTSKQTTGEIGEDIAAKFLVKHGFEVLERNYWKKFGEIDIICKKDGKIHFVEVKTVSRETSGKPFQIETHMEFVSGETKDEYRAEDNIHPAKLKRIGRTIEDYLSQKKTSEDWEFHAITIVLDESKRTARVRFLRDIVIGA